MFPGSPLIVTATVKLPFTVPRWASTSWHARRGTPDSRARRATTAPYPSLSPRARGALPYPGRQDPRDPAGRGEQQIGSMPHCPVRACLPSGVFRRRALTVPLSALPHGRPSRRGPGAAPGTASALSRTPHGDRQVAETTAGRPAWCRYSCPWPDRGRSAVPHRAGRHDEPGAPRSISMLTNPGDGAPDLACLAWRGLIPAGKAVWASGPG
jgi:hypothetical protein